MTLDMTPGSGRSRTQVWHCPPWCVSDHVTRAAIDEQVQLREHSSDPVVVESSVGSRATVAVVAMDMLDTGERSEADVHVHVDDVLDPASALRLAAALMDAADLAQGVRR